MSYEQYKAYKDDGVKCGKVSWVYDFWDSVDLDENQYNLLKKCADRRLIILAPLLMLLGVLFTLLFLVVING